jgi:hypothetical protein
MRVINVDEKTYLKVKMALRELEEKAKRRLLI